MKKFTTLILIFFALNSFSEDLLALYKEALYKDPDFNSKKADLEISQEFLNQSRSLLLPQLRAVGGTNWNEYYQDRELENDYNTFSYGLNLSQPLFRLDTRFQTKQAKKNFQAELISFLTFFITLSKNSSFTFLCTICLIFAEQFCPPFQNAEFIALSIRSSVILASSKRS